VIANLRRAGLVFQKARLIKCGCLSLEQTIAFINANSGWMGQN
jgi:hypothetical protein